MRHSGCRCIWFAVLITALGMSTPLFSHAAEGEEAQIGGGYIKPRVAAGADSIWRSGSNNEPDNASVTVTLSGSGSKGITLAPQDTIFIMDHSGSLETYDPQVLRILAAHEYVDNMVAPFDRAALIKFDTDAQIYNHLTAAYPQVHADLESLSTLRPQGQTNFQAAIDLVNSEFSTFGSDENQKIGILFTDGKPDPPSSNVTISQMDELVTNEVKLYTIGLGPDADVELLSWMAGYTGGEFYRAQTPEELVNIYMRISDQFYNYSAGQNTTLRLELTDDFDYMRGTSNITEDFTAEEVDGRWVLTWEVGDMEIGENWSVSFRVASPTGEGDTLVFSDDSNIGSNSWTGENVSEEVPSLYIKVIRSLPPPLPPPPPPPTPVTPAPIPPPPSVPVVAPSVNVAPVITATPNVAPVTIGQAATVPVEYMLAGLAAMGIAKRTAIRKKIVEKQRVSVGA